MNLHAEEIQQVKEFNFLGSMVQKMEDGTRSNKNKFPRCILMIMARMAMLIEQCTDTIS